jgi:hypothetical protein
LSFILGSGRSALQTPVVEQQQQQQQHEKQRVLTFAVLNHQELVKATLFISVSTFYFQVLSVPIHVETLVRIK